MTTTERRTLRSQQPTESRSESVRARRAPRSTRTHFNPQEIDRAGREAATRKPVVARPITTRSTNVVVPSHRRYQSTTAARKQYTISLSTPGAEIRLPALPGIQFGWRLASFILAVAMAVGVFGMFSSEQFQFQQARVVGAQRLTPDDIEGALRVAGMPVIEARPAEMEASLRAAFPDLSGVSVAVGLPASLTVNVVERQPVLVWKVGEKEQWIDAEGYAFPVRGSIAPAPTPEPPPAEGAEAQPAEAPTEAAPEVKLVTVEASGNPPAPAVPVTASEDGKALPPAASVEPAPFMKPEMVQALVELGKQAPEGTPIIYSPDYGFGWQDPEGWQVFFGQETGDMAVKLEQYRAIVENLKTQGVRPSMISVAFSHAPFYRLEQ